MSPAETGTRRSSPVDPATAEAQARATDPQRSAWVSANAGSGKTFVLSRRVVRLLLAGVDPARILCLTFTKAAAAEMSNRVFEELGRWTTLPEAELAAELAAIEGRPPSPGQVAKARQLFARALDTPGGLKIQTIHALCERILHQFPFEANVAGRFEVLDERDARALSDEARRATLARAAESPNGVLGEALATVLALASDPTVEASVAEFIERRDAMRAWIVAANSLDAAIAGLRTGLDVAKGETSDALWQEILDGAPLSAAEAGRLLERLSASSANDRAAAERLAPFVESSNPDSRIDAWLDFLMKDEATAPRAATSIATKAVRNAMPGFDAMVEAELARLGELLDRMRAAELFELSAAMLRLADAAIDEYERLKRVRGVLDFEDLVVKTVGLLLRADASRWVHYKLDRGLDHILVDEAQDTSPRQWQVVTALAAEFFAGAGASDALRTLFAVGDEKQSIFSFQGAAPAWFSRMQRTLGEKARGASAGWSDLELHLSFRSAPVVLAAVDEVFRDSEAHRGLAAEPGPPMHTARRMNEPGRVVVWPVIPQPPKPDTDDWAKPLDYLGQGSPEVRLARRIAGTIGDWLKRREVLDAPDGEGGPRPIRPGGILILTRSRGALTDAINRELKLAGIAIAGADRLVLTDHIAVMDLMALARVVLTPDDDLSLAALLKSPLVGLDEDALYALAHGRVGSLWSALGALATEKPELARARALVEGWRSEADTRDPHAFFACILAAGGGRKAFLRRLGPEADDVLDEVLAQALAFERRNIPSLEGFLDWLIASETEIKRDTDTLRDEVRVMTVHGAKGLEADIVFLVDNGARPVLAAHDPRVLPLGGDPDPEKPAPLVWMRSIKHMPRAVRLRVDAWRQKSEEEYRRLLYVGMTRARDRLYVVGISNQNSDRQKGWHGLVTKALEPEAAKTYAADGELEAMEWRAEPGAASIAPPLAVARAAEEKPPPWLAMPARPPPTMPRRLTPSTALARDADIALPPVERRVDAIGDALFRGRLIHRLLQSLPAHPVEARRDAGARYLATVAGGASEGERAALLAMVLAVLDDPEFAPVFAPGSRAEIEIAGTVPVKGAKAQVSGRIDRLAVTADRVLVVDYKTNRPPPRRLADVPADYVAQLALYRRVLEPLYPRKTVVAAILWTEGPALMEIPSSTLDEALARMTET